MKTQQWIIWPLAMALGLAACMPTASTGTATETAGLPVTNTTPAAPNPAGQTLPLSAQLLVGTFKLERTEQAITAEQAQTLLPLWQAVQSLGNSSAAAPQETEAVVSQIQASMTAEQMASITALNLTAADLRAQFEAYGLTPPIPAGGTPRAQRTPNANATPGAGDQFGPGGFGGDPGAFGGAPADGGVFGAPGAQGQLSTEQQATLEARRAAGGGRPDAGVNTGLVAELIKLLEARAGSS